jgi:hypothetical protein
VAPVGDEGDRLTRIAAVPENDACSALGEAYGYGLADAPGRFRSPALPVRRGVQRFFCWHVTCPFCDGEPIAAYEVTAGFRTSSAHWRKLVGVEFSGVR